MTTLSTSSDARLFDLIRLATNGLGSRHSRRSYARAIEDFWRWAEGRPFSKATVREYQQFLMDSGASPATVNARITAIRRLAQEAGDNQMIPFQVAEGIRHVHGTPQRVQRSGNWLSLDQTERLINSPRQGTPKGIRDRALLGVLIGCGLRREEAAGLKWADIQQREGRWVIVDLHGKGGRVRTVPMPAWSKALLDQWRGISIEAWPLVFCPIRKGGEFGLPPLDADAIYLMVRGYCRKLGLGSLSPHDMRRTFARLTFAAKAPLDQIQITLGHSSIQTTERYVNAQQSLTHAPCDFINVRIDK